MNFKQDIIAHTFRNKYLKYTGGSYTTSKASSTTDYTATLIANWFYEDDNGNLHSRLSFVGDKEISAYGVGDDSGTGSITIIDNLLSNATDCALSANQGRVLNEKIEDIIEQGVGGVTSWDDLEDKPALLTDENIQKWNTQTHTHSNKIVLDGITSAKTTNWDSAYTHISDTTKHITSAERTNWNTAYNNKHTHSNKSVLDGITSTKVGNWDGVVTNWNKAFYFDSNNNLRVKLNLVGEGEVSAYGAGTSGTGIITIVDNLTSTATDCALSANQGRVLKGLIDSKVSSWNDIKDKPSTFTPSTHTHNYASTVKVGSTSYNVNSNIISLPAYPTTLKNPNALTISLNGTSQGAYDGSTAKSINITASSVGAAASSHTHTISQITNLQSTLDSKLNSSAYTAADILSKLKTVDGSGSGLDADTLDGVHNGFVSGRLHTYSLPYTDLDKKNYWVKIATLKLTSQYSSQEAILLISEGYTLTSKSYYAFVSVRIQQQNSMGNIPNVSLKAFGSISNSNIVGILNYNSSSSTLDVYYREVDVYLRGYVSYVQGTADIRTNSQELIATLPSGTQIISTNDCRCGYSDNSDKLDGVQLNGLFTALSSSSGTNLSATIGGVTKTVADLYATQAVNADTVDNYHAIGASGNIIKKRGYTGGSTTPYWYRLAKYSTTNTENNTDVAFFLHSSFDKRYGILLIRLRGGEYVDSYFLVSYGMDTTKIRVYYDSTKKNVELYYYASENYSIMIAELLYNTHRNGNISNDVIMYENNNIAPSYSTYINPTFVSIQNNSASATKLQTARTLWGQSFDGTNNVSGNMTGVGSISASGNIVAGGEITAYSDKRLKSNIQILEDRGYITPVTYIKDGKQSIGFLAQEVREKYPELVTEDTNEEKYLSLNYAQYTAVLQAQIIELNNRIKQLESKL